MSLVFNWAEYDRKCIAEFGAPVLLRMESYGEFEVLVGGTWHKCGLADLNISTPTAFVESMKRITERATA